MGAGMSANPGCLVLSTVMGNANRQPLQRNLTRKKSRDPESLF